MAGISLKSVSRQVNYAHDPASVKDFCNSYIQAERSGVLISIDEAGFYVGDHRRRGWAPRGERLSVKSGKSLRRTKFTLLLAVSQQGVVGYEVLDHNCKKPDFVQFIQKLNAPRGSVLMMDNIQFHHSRETKDAACAKGFNLLYTPPYSPRMNPVEYIFGTVKPEYRHQCPGNFEPRFDYPGLLRSLLDERMQCDFSRYFAHVARLSEETLKAVPFTYCGYG